MVSAFDIQAPNKEFVGKVMDLASVVFVEGFDDFWNDTILASSFAIGELGKAFVEHDEADFFVVFMFRLEMLHIFFNVFEAAWALGILYFF